MPNAHPIVPNAIARYHIARRTQPPYRTSHPATTSYALSLSPPFYPWPRDAMPSLLSLKSLPSLSLSFLKSLLSQPRGASSAGHHGDQGAGRPTKRRHTFPRAHWPSRRSALPSLLSLLSLPSLSLSSLKSLLSQPSGVSSPARRQDLGRRQRDTA